MPTTVAGDHATGVAQATGRTGRGALWRRRVVPAPRALDVPAVNLVARIRVAVAVVVAAVGSFLPGLTREESALFLIFGLVWVPWSTVVLLASARPNSRLALVGGPFGDLVVLFGIQVVAPDAAQVVLLGYVVVIAFAASSAGRRVAAELAALSFVLTFTAQVLAPPSQRLGALALVPFAVAVLAIVFLVNRTTVLQTRANVRAQHYRTRAETVLANVADAVVVTDGRGTVLECNPSAGTLSGRPAQDMEGRSCRDALGLWCGQRQLDCSDGCELLHLSARAGPLEAIELWRLDGGNMRQPLLASAAPVPNDDGGTDVVHSLRDVTRLKQAEEAKTLFLATASHELKTPLTVIRGFADVLKDYEALSPNARREALDAISVRSNQLTHIVERLLLSSRIEAGAITLATESVAVGPLAQERVVAVAKATGRGVSCDISRAVPPVAGNVDAMVTVIDHLLDNALKYSPKGEPVRVGADVHDESVTVTVADQGIGMAPDQVAHCFDKFWQAESTDVRRFGGTGIGLYIVQSLVEAMGGTIVVSSHLGEGSTFAVTLRRADVAPVDDAAGATSPEELRDGGRPGVGEQTSIREFMRQIGIPGGGGR